MADTTISTAEAARRAGVSGDTIRRWIRIGLLHPVVRVGPGRRYRLDPDELKKLLSSGEPSAAAEPELPAVVNGTTLSLDGTSAPPAESSDTEPAR